MAVEILIVSVWTIPDKHLNWASMPEWAIPPHWGYYSAGIVGETVTPPVVPPPPKFEE